MNKKAFNPSLLTINTKASDIYELNLAFDFTKKWSKYFLNVPKLRVPRNNQRTSLLDDLVNEVNNTWGASSGTITLFLTNFQCYDVIPSKDENVTDGKAGVNGISNTGNNKALMFLGNSSEQELSITPKTELPHELMHCLSLPHDFPETGKSQYAQCHYFTRGSTDNYMDYKNTVEHTFHFQWEIMQNSKFSK